MIGRGTKAIGCSFLVLLISIPFLHLVSEVLFSMKQSAIEKAVASAHTQADFVHAAESHGMTCDAMTGVSGRVICVWWDFPVYDLVAWVEFVGEGVQAVGYFVDGAKSRDYLVRKVLSGP